MGLAVAQLSLCQSSVHGESAADPLGQLGPVQRQTLSIRFQKFTENRGG